MAENVVQMSFRIPAERRDAFQKWCAEQERTVQGALVGLVEGVLTRTARRPNGGVLSEAGISCVHTEVEKFAHSTICKGCKRGVAKDGAGYVLVSINRPETITLEEKAERLADLRNFAETNEVASTES